MDDKEYGIMQEPDTATEPVAEPEPVAMEGSSKPVMILMGVMFVLMIGLSIYVAIALSGYFHFGQKEDSQYQSGTENPWDEIFGDNGGQKNDQNKQADGEDPKESGQARDGSRDPSFSAMDLIDWDDEKWMDYPNHKASEYADAEYYEDFGDCIDESVSYRVRREYDNIYDRELGVCLRASYVQLEGNIPNLDEINRKLEEEGCYYLQYYEDEQERIDRSLKDNDNNIFLSKTSCYVPYNDEDTISVVFQDEVMLAEKTSIHLVAVNINLITGTVLDNEGILNLPDDFGSFFRERSGKQNGTSYGTEEFTDQQILSMLRSEENLIVFYTPVGLEVGYEYTTSDNGGWITISLKDYKKYLWGV